MQKHIEYFVAPQSPYAYLGHQRFVAIAKKYDAKVLLKPFDVARIFSLSGGVPVAQRPPQRQAYRLEELTRWSQHLDCPLNLHPKFFPVSGEMGAKLIIAAEHANGTAVALDLAGSLGRAVWAEEKNIADAETLTDIANRLGLDGKSLIEMSQGEKVGHAYAQFTEEAIAVQVFGVPWYRINGGNFWGQDRLEFVERALAD